MSQALQQVLDALNLHRFTLETEKDLQRQIAERFDLRGLPYEREKRLSHGSIIDFLALGVGVEVKLKMGGHVSAKAFYEQCARYCLFPEVEQLLLVTNKTITLPALLHGKPTHVHNLGLAWL